MKPSPKKIKFDVQYMGEHHMGAASIDIILENAFKGVTKFRTTNGGVVPDPNGRFLVIFDSTMFLVLDSKETTVHHFMTGRDYQVPRFEHGILVLPKNSGGSKQQLSFNLDTKSGLQAGFGSVSKGKFPSAYP